MLGKLGLPEILVIFVMLMMVALYFLPAIIAFAREHENKAAITILNIFAGWTFVGWLVALIWAFVKKQQPQVIIVQK